MKINVENCSSPGASFTKNTNHVMLVIYEWIVEQNHPTLSFREFRSLIEKDKKVNDNNNRNIYPLLKNCGFINYEKGENLVTEHFFTNKGLAYVKALETVELLKTSDYSNDKKEQSFVQIHEILEQLIFEGLEKLLQSGANYTDAFKDFIRFIALFDKINKVEFTYLLYYRTHCSDYAFEEIATVINQYRNNDIEIDVVVNVRNDIELRETTSNTRRNEGIEYLTSYSYFVSLLAQAGLITKDNDYYLLKSTCKEKISKLLEV